MPENVFNEKLRTHSCCATVRVGPNSIKVTHHDRTCRRLLPKRFRRVVGDHIDLSVRRLNSLAVAFSNNG